MTGADQVTALVVDDSEFFARMTAETLATEHGIETSYETDPNEALDRLADLQVDCVVSDYEMPGIDGLEFLEMVQRRYEDVPFILLTGRGDEEVASEAIASGVADYLLKLEVVEDEQYQRLANRIRNVVQRRRTRRKYELLVDNTPDAIAHVAVDGEILAANRALAERLATTTNDLVGRDLPSVSPGDVGEGRLAAGREVVEHGEATRLEDAHGGRHFHNIVVPVETGGSEASFQLISRDITDRVERERELRRQNERLETFASVVSHDLRNPLTVAQNSAELVADELPDDPNVDRIDRSLERMAAIIEDVITLARQGERVDDLATVDLGTVARDAWSFVEADEVTLETDVDLRIAADADRLTDLLGNLFANAVEHGGEDVTVSVGRTNDGFYVADDGTGIPPEDREDVFEMGYSTSRGGTGLGLTIVREIAGAHGWAVTVRESQEGGARFEVTGVERR